MFPTGGRDPIWVTPFLGRQRLDEPGLFERGERAIESSGAEGDAGEALDVLDECVPMLRRVGKAGEDQDAAVRRAADRVPCHLASLCLQPRYIGNCNITRCDV